MNLAYWKSSEDGRIVIFSISCDKYPLAVVYPEYGVTVKFGDGSYRVMAMSLELTAPHRCLNEEQKFRSIHDAKMHVEHVCNQIGYRVLTDKEMALR